MMPLSFLLAFAAIEPSAQAAQASWQTIGQVGGPTQCVAVQGRFAYAGVGMRLVVLDISNPSDPVEISVTKPFPHFVQDVAVSGTLAFIAAGSGGLRVVDVSDPRTPAEVGSWSSRGYAEGVAVAGNFAFLADGPYGLRVLDVSKPSQPVEVGSAYSMNYGFKVAVQGSYAYMAAAGAGLLIVDVADPRHPLEVGSLDTEGYAYGVAVTGNTAYVADGWDGVKVVDVSNPARPNQTGAFKTPGWAFGVTIAGTRAYVADAFRGLRVVNVADPTRPIEVAFTEISGGHAANVVVADGMVIVADRNRGLLILNATPPAGGPGSLSPIGSYTPMGFAHGVVAADTHAYVAAGPYGLRIIDVSNPALPLEVGAYDTDSYAVIAAVVGDYAYVATNTFGSAGLHIVDIHDRTRPTRAAFVPGNHGSNRDLVVSGGVAYLPNEWGLLTVDVSNPRAPRELAFLELKSVTGQENATVGIAVSGGLAYVAAAQKGILVVDVSKPAAPVLIGVFGWQTAMAEGIQVSGRYAYVASGGATILDLSDPARPGLMGNYGLPLWAEGIAQSGDLAFVANGGSGVRVVDVSNPKSPALQATIDTAAYAQRVAIRDGVLYVADSDGGLLIIKKSAAAAATSFASALDVKSPPTAVRSPVIAGSPRLPPTRWDRAHRDRATSGTRPASNAGQACVVTSTADSGAATLRWCLQNATRESTITFDPTVFPPAHPSTIALLSALPNLDRDAMTIDASNAGVVIDGGNLPVGNFGLFLVSNGNSIMGLQVLHVRSVGIVVSGNGNRIGGDRTRGAGPLGQGNLISGNTDHGVMIGGDDNTVTGNMIGTDVSGTIALSNANHGIVITGGAHGNRIGGATPGERNIISGNRGCGIDVMIGSDGNTVVGNYIGVDVSGTRALGNGDKGVVVESSNNNRIGGATGGERNVVSANGRDGISLNTSATGNQVRGNYVGLSADGNSALANQGSGINLEGGAYANLFAGNSVGLSGAFGIAISDWGSSYNEFVGNLIGLDASGTRSFPGAEHGVWVGSGAAYNRIGGTAVADRNVIIGTIVFARQGAVGNLVLGNFIGTDIAGTRGLGASGPGIGLTSGARRPFIGGATPAEGNIIGSGELGIQGNPGGNYAFIAGNSIGVDATGAIPLGNRGDGIQLVGAHNHVQGNRIAFNSASGIGAASLNTVRANSIFGNAGPGIATPGLESGGAAPPVVTSASPGAANGIACASCAVEIFSDSGGQGRIFEGSIAADASGTFSFVKGGPLTGPNITATATDRSGSTSTFSAAVSILGKAQLNLGALNPGGASKAMTIGNLGPAQVGYADITVNSGTTPYATAVFRYTQNNVVVSETAVPSSPPTKSARIFIDYRFGALSVPGRNDSGLIDINTGFALVNYGSNTATVTYSLRNASGNTITIGHGSVVSGRHHALFIDQLKSIAPDFNLPSDFSTAAQFATLEISADQPLSVVALRQVTNQRQEVLFTTTPVADLTQASSIEPVFFAQFVDGGGYAMTLMLMNTSPFIETGLFQILDDNGSPMPVHQVGGSSGSSFSYRIFPGGFLRFQTDGQPAASHSGWVRLTPDSTTSTPVGAAVFSYNPAGVLITESGVPAASPTTHARIYVDLSGYHNTGLAIANVSGIGSTISTQAFRSDGTTAIGLSNGPLPLAAGGHTAKFADELIAGLPPGFTGVLDLSSTSPFAALTLRALYNERHDFILTTLPIADLTRPAPSPIVFPQIADGGGFVTEFILLGAGGASSTTIKFYNQSGTPLAVGK